MRPLARGPGFPGIDSKPIAARGRIDDLPAISHGNEAAA
jgi:hypothetical protein